MSPIDGYHEFVIRDFKKPSLNGILYDLTDEATQDAIASLCKRNYVYGELGHPVMDLRTPFNEQVRRCMQVQLDRTVVEIRSIRFNETESTLHGYVKPVGEMFPNLLQLLRERKVTFGMRSFTNPSTRRLGREKIMQIVTFDIIDLPQA